MNDNSDVLKFSEAMRNLAREEIENGTADFLDFLYDDDNDEKGEVNDD